MRSNYEIDIRREDKTRQVIPMRSTAYQANKALAALGCALNASKVVEVILWLVTKDSRHRVNGVKYTEVAR